MASKVGATRTSLDVENSMRSSILRSIPPSAMVDGVYDWFAGTIQMAGAMDEKIRKVQVVMVKSGSDVQV